MHIYDIQGTSNSFDAAAFDQTVYFLPRCICLISNWTFVSSFKQFLCGLYRISLGKLTFPIERYICNFIDDIPAPPAGKVDVTYYLGEVINIMVIFKINYEDIHA